MREISLFFVVLLCRIPAVCGQSNDPEPAEITHLVLQLGSEDRAQQEAAAVALRKLGATALGPLRIAAGKNTDIAIRRRARMLVKMLEPHANQVWCNYAGPWDEGFREISYRVESVAFSPDSRQVASAGGFSGNVKTWDVVTGAEVRRFKTGRIWTNRVVFSHDGRYLAGVGVSDDKDGNTDIQGSVIFVWEAATGNLVHRLKGTRFEGSVAFSKDGRQIVSAGETVRWWDLKTGKVVKTFHLKNFFRYWGLSSDGLYVMGHKKNRKNDYADSLIDLAAEKEMAHFPYGANAVAYSPDGNAVLFSGKLRLRDARSGKELISFQENRVLSWLSLACLSHGPVAANCARFISAGIAGPTQKANANDVDVSADGRRALSAHGDELSMHGPGGYLGLLLAVIARLTHEVDGSVRLWDLETGKELHRFIGHHGAVRTVAFSPDGCYAASASAYGQLRLWKLPK